MAVSPKDSSIQSINMNGTIRLTVELRLPISPTHAAHAPGSRRQRRASRGRQNRGKRVDLGSCRAVLLQALGKT